MKTKHGVPLNNKSWTKLDKENFSLLSNLDKLEWKNAELGHLPHDETPLASTYTPARYYCSKCNDTGVTNDMDICACVRQYTQTPRARKHDPETSHLSAKKVKVTAKRTIILDYLNAHGPATQKEISVGTGIPEISCSPVLRPMARAGLVVTCGTKPNSTGHLAIIWRAI